MLKKVGGFAWQDTAVGFYRVIQPLRFLKRTNKVKEVMSAPFSGSNDPKAVSIPDKTLMRVAKDADAIITTLLHRDADFLKMLDVREWAKTKLIVDVDDNMYAVPRDNAAYYNVKLVLPRMERFLRFADGIIVSVPNLKQVYGHLNENIFVNKNTLDFEKPYEWKPDAEGNLRKFKSWDELSQEPKSHKGIRIGWEGASGHVRDLEIIRPVMEKIKENYPEVKFVCFGHKPDFCDEWHDWVSVSEYPTRLAGLELDIGLAPLIDSSYNRCKSNLRYLQYSALNIPTVMSPTENQTGCVALYARTNYEWYEAISKLIEDKKYRDELGKQAGEFVRKNFNAKDAAKDLAEWIEKLPRRTDYKPDMR